MNAATLPLSRITVGAMEDIWGAGSVNFANAEPFNNCRRGLATGGSTNTTNTLIESGVIMPVNIDEVLMNRARAGIPILQYQLDLLPEAKQQAVVETMQVYGAALVDV